MDSDGSPPRHSTAHGKREFCVPHVTLFASTKTQGGKTNEQEKKSHNCSSGCGKGSHP